MYWKGPKTEQDFPDFSSDSQKVYKAFHEFFKLFTNYNVLRSNLKQNYITIYFFFLFEAK